jgi:two-component system, OmpR family, response regulator SaeR
MPKPLLFVDDQTDILAILQREFAKTGDYAIFTASSPEEAVSVLNSVPVDLVITDVRLGEANGFKLMRELREQRPDVGVMMMTAYRSPTYRQQADQLGVAFFVEKPFAVKTLLLAVERYFLQRQSPLQAMRTAPSVDAMTHFRLQDLVQLFCLNGRAVVLTVEFEAQASPGIVVIQKGRVWHVEWGNVQGEPAFHKLFGMTDSRLGIRELGAEEFPHTIQCGWEFLLLESARQSDEAPEAKPKPLGAASAAIPLPTAMLDPFADFWKTARLPGGGKLKLSR